MIGTSFMKDLDLLSAANIYDKWLEQNKLKVVDCEPLSLSKITEAIIQMRL